MRYDELMKQYAVELPGASVRELHERVVKELDRLKEPFGKV